MAILNSGILCPKCGCVLQRFKPFVIENGIARPVLEDEPEYQRLKRRIKPCCCYGK